MPFPSIRLAFARALDGRRLLWLPSLLLCAVTAQADVAPSAVTALQPEDGQLLDQRGPEAAERLYPLGALRRIGGALRMDGRLQAHGELASATWELPAERNAADVFKVARLALQGEGNRALFWCEGRECGESNLWSNDILANTRLLGSDDQQGFLLVRQAREGADTLIAVYCVLRGNRRVALHVETFAPSAPLGQVLPTPGTVLRELREAGEVSFPELVPPPAADWVALLARVLSFDSALRLRLSGAAADQWVAALAGSGVRASRLSVGDTAGQGLKMEIVR
ncbi:DUF4892 domain-containing protein [Pseudomonas sp. Marseille-Q5115]|uniref:DUF4892 domain-containing protein n=1 Tax=Pseudomonas sp. Marseille-Q5115 TaxID=2866593 RepID=UPI001CE40937|nr:DUF4892 domain-containing protein [Pseudomonas sp. Marseille-Q5115]